MEKQIERKILSIIACGNNFGGKDNNSWTCGDFLEEETDEEGRSLGRCYYCENCHRKTDTYMGRTRWKKYG